MVGRSAIPSSRVKTPKGAKKFPERVIVFKAGSEIKLPTKFEPFAPTVYQPRGECYADYPRTGTYYFAVWAAKDTKPGIYHYTLGLGMAERDVMKTTTTIVSDYMMVKVYMETRWTVLGVVWPVILGLVLSQAGLCF